MKQRLPRIFVASSSERLNIAYAIQELLEFDGEVTVWTEGTFKPSGYTIDDLSKAIDSHEFGIFVFVPDDRVLIRGENLPAIRDNLLFEFGLFAGMHGRQCCFFVLERDSGAPHLPSDFAGLNPLLFSSNRTDDNVLAALGPSCNQVRRAIAESYAQIVASSKDGPQFDLPLAQDYISSWQSQTMAQALAVVRRSSLDPYDPEAGQALKVLRRVFALLESMASAVLSGRVDESTMRTVFEIPVRGLWPYIATSLAPPNHADDWWDPPPLLATLFQKWV